MISSILSRASALVLTLTGLPLLFASDEVLPLLLPGIPASSAWLGQLLAAAWLSVAFHDWNARGQVLGGVYGRPTVSLNLTLYAISALGLVRVEAPTPLLRAVTVVFALMAVAYGMVLLRGPFDRSPTATG